MKSFPVKQPSQIVDTTGCGDAFVGGENIYFSQLLTINYFCLGFLAYRSLNRSVNDCIKAACYCAHECLLQTGCHFSNKSSFNPTE